MWLLKVPKKYGDNLCGDLFGYRVINGYVLMDKQYVYNFMIYKGFTDHTPANWEHKKPDPLGKVLLVHYGGLGDCFMMTIVAKAIKEQYPNAEVTVATGAAPALLFKNNPHVSHYMLEEGIKIPFFIDQFDDVICFDAIIAGNRYSQLRNVYDEYIRWSGYNRPKEMTPVIEFSAEELQGTKEHLKREYNIEVGKDKFVIIQHEASTTIRNWEREKFFDFAEKLVDRGYKALMFGHSGQMQNYIYQNCSNCKTKNVMVAREDVVHLVKECCKCKKPIVIRCEGNRSSDRKGVYFVNNLDIRGIASLIKLANFHIGIDSVGQHIAGACDTPQLGIFACFDGDLRMRYFKKSRWLQKKYMCAPSFIHHITCPDAGRQKETFPDCMKAITVDEVYQEFLKLESGDYSKPSPFVPAKSRPCPICGSEEREFVTRRGDVCQYECKVCFCVYADQEKDGSEYYCNPRYYTGYHTDEYINGQRLFARKVHETFAKHCEYSGSVLEVGCGEGDQLAELKRLGWKVKGVDTSTAHAKKYKKLGIDVSIMPFEKFKTKQKFDVIYMNQAFEHFHQPMPIVEKAVELLSDRGTISILVPDPDTWQPKDNNKWGNNLTYYPGEHTVMPCERTMRYIADKYNLELTTINMPQLACSWFNLRRK